MSDFISSLHDCSRAIADSTSRWNSCDDMWPASDGPDFVDAIGEVSICPGRMGARKPPLGDLASLPAGASPKGGVGSPAATANGGSKPEGEVFGVAHGETSWLLHRHEEASEWSRVGPRAGSAVEQAELCRVASAIFNRCVRKFRSSTTSFTVAALPPRSWKTLSTNVSNVNWRRVIDSPFSDKMGSNKMSSMRSKSFLSMLCCMRMTCRSGFVMSCLNSPIRNRLSSSTS
mmetsp:Transcript_92815/g.259397  ORF Transcript_92815/g.259397 Transcript_92815/m.259397 type:complete len:231 (-) Transcript_92815:1438-2130(-)